MGGMPTPGRSRAWRLAGIAATLMTLLQPVGDVYSQVLPGLLKAEAPSASASEVKSTSALPAAENWADRLAEARAAHERLLADADAPAATERRRVSSRLIALLTTRVERERAPKATATSPAGVSTAVTLRGEPPYPVPEVDALRDQRDSLRAQHDALTLTLKSLDREVEAALQARRKAAEALRLRQEQWERGRSGAEAAALQGQLELAPDAGPTLLRVHLKPMALANVAGAVARADLQFRSANFDGQKFHDQK